MIHFNKNLFFKSLDIVKNSYDCADVLNDLNRIDRSIASVKSCGNWVPAYNLDNELRQKYPCIDEMLQFAHNFHSISTQSSTQLPPAQAVVSNLEQDYCGILCSTAIKKGVVHNIKDFIETID